MEIAQNIVAVVVDPDFGPHLPELAARCPVWIRNSGCNDPVIQATWREAREGDSGTEVTSFRAGVGDDPERLLLDIWAMVNLHHPSLGVLEVYGARLTPAVAAELQEYGLTLAEVRVDGFTITKTEQATV